jgi:hypothetical protein
VVELQEGRVPFYFNTVTENEEAFKPRARRTLIPFKGIKGGGEQIWRHAEGRGRSWNDRTTDRERVCDVGQRKDSVTESCSFMQL